MLRGVSVGMSAAIPDKLNVGDILQLCEGYDATVIDFEKIIAIENTIYPMIQQNISKQEG